MQTLNPAQHKAIRVESETNEGRPPRQRSRPSNHQSLTENERG